MQRLQAPGSTPYFQPCPKIPTCSVGFSRPGSQSRGAKPLNRLPHGVALRARTWGSMRRPEAPKYPRQRRRYLCALLIRWHPMRSGRVVLVRLFGAAGRLIRSRYDSGCVDRAPPTMCPRQIGGGFFVFLRKSSFLRYLILNTTSILCFKQIEPQYAVWTRSPRKNARSAWTQRSDSCVEEGLRCINVF